MMLCLHLILFALCIASTHLAAAHPQTLSEVRCDSKTYCRNGYHCCPDTGCCQDGYDCCITKQCCKGEPPEPDDILQRVPTIKRTLPWTL